jgi:hypothetical protein
MPLPEWFACPYCDAELGTGALSCRCCGRDLTPVLPLLRRLDALESRLAAHEQAAQEAAVAAPVPAVAVVEHRETVDMAGPTGRRRFSALAIGFVALLAVYWAVVLWLDLPLSVLRLVSIVLPFVVGAHYLGRRPRLTWFDTGIAVLFAICAVAAMNALLGWIDQIPIVPQGTAAWRESFFYALSIGASMFSGMLLRVSQAALAARGLTSLPRLRDGVLAANGKMPMDMLKAIELSILMVSTAISAIAGLLAGFLGVTR